MADARRKVLDMRHITKRFPGIVANDDVSLDLYEGEVEIMWKPVRLGTPSAAIDAGVGMVHQHFMLIPVMTVAENIVLGMEPKHEGVILDTGEANERVQEISERFGLAVDPRATIEDITVGQQ